MVSWWMAVLATTSLAHADAYYLESDPVAIRERAEDVSSALAGAGCTGQVLRRYVRGEGWRFVVRTLAVADAELARGCLAAIAADDDVPLRLVERSGMRHRVVGGATSPEAAVVVANPRVGARAPWTAADVVARLLRTHAASAGNGSQDLLFRYTRLDGEGLEVRHVFARRGEDLYLDVQVVAGPGTSSRAGVSAHRPWLEGQDTKLDEAVVREQLLRFGPEGVFPLASAFARGVFEDPAREQLHVLSVGDGTCVVGTEGDRVTRPLRLYVDTVTWRLMAVERGERSDAVRWTYQGWRDVADGAIWPKAVEVTRQGRLLDRVLVEELELSPTLPEDWFAPPPAP